MCGTQHCRILPTMQLRSLQLAHTSAVKGFEPTTRITLQQQPKSVNRELRETSEHFGHESALQLLHNISVKESIPQILHISVT